jgi:hypothetical protein
VSSRQILALLCRECQKPEELGETIVGRVTRGACKGLARRARVQRLCHSQPVAATRGENESHQASEYPPPDEASDLPPFHDGSPPYRFRWYAAQQATNIMIQFTMPFPANVNTTALQPAPIRNTAARASGKKNAQTVPPTASQAVSLPR